VIRTAVALDKSARTLRTEIHIPNCDLGGVTAGDNVVMNPSDALRDGNKVFSRGAERVVLMSDQSETLRKELVTIMSRQRDIYAACILEGQELGEIT
jgi:hypothetical protein